MLKLRHASVGICLSMLLATTSWFPAARAQDPVATDDIGVINPEAAAHAFPKRGFSPMAP